MENENVEALVEAPVIENSQGEVSAAENEGVPVVESAQDEAVGSTASSSLRSRGRARKKNNTVFLVQFALLFAIEALFCFTPLGSIPINPIVSATLGMLPVIITAILLGTVAGTVMGFFAGVFSFIVWTFMPPNPLTAFAFTPFYSLGTFSGNFGSVLICFVPRILVGTVSGLLFRVLNAALGEKKHIISAVIAAVVGSLINTVGVMGGIWLFFGDQYSEVVGETMLYIIGFTVLVNGLPEAGVSGILVPIVTRSVSHVLSKKIR